MLFKSGFLIVLNFNRLYERYVDRYKFESEIYAIPRIDKSPEDYLIMYRGIDRDSICGYSTSDMLAGIRLYELQEEGKSEDDFLFEESDALDVFIKEK